MLELRSSAVSLKLNSEHEDDFRSERERKQFFLGVGNNKQEPHTRHFELLLLTILTPCVVENIYCARASARNDHTTMKLRIPRRIKTQEPVEDSSSEDDGSSAAAKKQPEATSNSQNQTKDKSSAKSTTTTAAVTVSKFCHHL